MAEPDESFLRDDDDVSGQQEDKQPPATFRTDLFGESESDDEDLAPTPAPPEGQETADPASAEEQPEEEQPEEAQPEAEPQAHAPPADAAEAYASTAAEARDQEQPGRHDDVFASDSEDEGRPGGGQVSEAEEEDEEDEFEALFQTGKKRKRDKGRSQEIVLTVETLIANMEVAAEMDISANEEGKPAVNKIKMLPAVEDKLSQTVLHRELLDGGILGALKLWIELLPDGSLPNVKVRTVVLKMLAKLPIDLNLEGRKEQLKKSELGKYVMFYSKLPDETLPNRQLARALVEKWSRPVFEQYRERAQDEEMQEREAELARLRKRRKQEAERAAATPDAAAKSKPGDPGFRWHASIPAPARLDYMRRPESNLPAGEGEAVKGKAKPKDKMSKKLAAMSRKGGKGPSGQHSKCT